MTVVVHNVAVMKQWHDELGVFDLETTGVDVDTSRIVSAHVGVLDAAGEVIERLDWLVNPGVVIPDGATAVHGITTQRAEVDMIKFSGPAFTHIDNRLMSLVLVENGLANAAMFTADGEVVQAAEMLYKKAILVERGSFRPVWANHFAAVRKSCWQWSAWRESMT